MLNRWDDTKWDAADFECDPTAFPGERELTPSPRSGGMKAHPHEKMAKKATISRITLAMNVEDGVDARGKRKLESKRLRRIETLGKIQVLFGKPDETVP